jgi:hypothetical protein
MKIAFTICSANYLPFAKSLGDSIVGHNPDYLFWIILVDKHKNINYSFFEPHRIIYIDELSLPAFEEMNNRYDIFELSCALKPFVTEWILENSPESEVVCYFDSDIVVYNRLTEISASLNNAAVLLTPHILTPLPNDGKASNEAVLLQAGLYNAGFFAVNHRPQALKFLKWWKERLINKCFNDVRNGLFVDQLWLNFAPLYFDEVHLLQHPGYNVAYWNLHERRVLLLPDKKTVNDQYPLVFFHFSGYDFKTPDVISKHQNRYSYKTHPQFEKFFQLYRNEVRLNNIDNLLDLPVSYGIKHNR